MLIEYRPDAARFDPLIDYTPYAVQFRYGIGDSGSVPLDRDTALQRTQALLNEQECALRRFRRRDADLWRPDIDCLIPAG